jgi:hypothetical protein
MPFWFRYQISIVVSIFDTSISYGITTVYMKSTICFNLIIKSSILVAFRVRVRVRVKVRVSTPPYAEGRVRVRVSTPPTPNRGK